jgi:hypothetical protein
MDPGFAEIKDKYMTEYCMIFAAIILLDNFVKNTLYGNTQVL